MEQDQDTCDSIFLKEVELVAVSERVYVDESGCNARFHRKKAVSRILGKVGCRALFLPPYSPDLNPIEAQWHRLKNRVRTNRLCGMNFKDALETALL